MQPSLSQVNLTAIHSKAKLEIVDETEKEIQEKINDEHN
jgi:hypothetical protein